MALTMCPTWALAVDGGITTLPAPEGQMPAVDSTPTGDTIQTPDAGTQGQTKPQDTEQAGQLENQDSEQAPSGGTDIEETGNNSSSMKMILRIMMQKAMLRKMKLACRSHKSI